MSAAPAIPRADRDMARGRLAADKLRAQGANATTCALEMTRVAFDLTAKHNGLKMRVEKVLRLGAGHPEIQARFRNEIDRVVTCGLDIDDTLQWLEGWIVTTRQLLARGRGIGLPLMVLTEARMALRWVRRYRPGAFAEIVGELSGARLHLEAAE